MMHGQKNIKLLQVNSISFLVVIKLRDINFVVITFKSSVEIYRPVVYVTNIVNHRPSPFKDFLNHFAHIFIRFHHDCPELSKLSAKIWKLLKLQYVCPTCPR